jgi:hypothetical protein
MGPTPVVTLMEMETTPTPRKAKRAEREIRVHRAVETYSLVHLCGLHIGGRLGRLPRIRILHLLLPTATVLLIRKCGNRLGVDLGLLLSLRELLLLLECGWVERRGPHGILRETIGHIKDEILRRGRTGRDADAEKMEGLGGSKRGRRGRGERRGDGGRGGRADGKMEEEGKGAEGGGSWWERGFEVMSEFEYHKVYGYFIIL